MVRRKFWWARQDSNLQPDRYERSALTVELQAHLFESIQVLRDPRPGLGTQNLALNARLFTGFSVP